MFLNSVVFCGSEDPSFNYALYEKMFSFMFPAYFFLNRFLLSKLEIASCLGLSLDIGFQ